ncbi:hypothetical protein LPJ79_004672 [Coemansia sp. RSA 1821]|nr:hypothetical protein LPJ79_004672 [Coemansia sp. RSA 1821]
MGDYVYIKFYNNERYSVCPVNSSRTPKAICSGFSDSDEKIMLLNDRIYYTLDDGSSVHLDFTSIPEIKLFPMEVEIDVECMGADGVCETKRAKVTPTIQYCELVDLSREMFNVPDYIRCEFCIGDSQLDIPFYNVDFPSARFVLKQVPKE